MCPKSCRASPIRQRDGQASSECGLARTHARKAERFCDTNVYLSRVQQVDANIGQALFWLRLLDSQSGSQSTPDLLSERHWLAPPGTHEVPQLADPVGCWKSDLRGSSYTPPRLPEFEGQAWNCSAHLVPVWLVGVWASYKGDPNLTALRLDAAKHVVPTPASPESVATAASGLLLLLPAAASRMRAVWCHCFKHLSSISSSRICAHTAMRVLVGPDGHPCGIHAAGALCRMGCAAVSTPQELLPTSN